MHIKSRDCEHILRWNVIQKGVARICIRDPRSHEQRQRMPSKSNGNGPDRSLNSNLDAKITFHNASDQSVAVLWLNFDGDPVWHHQLLPRCTYTQPTYVNHAWVCVECDTGLFSLMRMNNKHVLVAEANQLHAVITAEETSLFQQCLAAVRISLHQARNVSLVEQLEKSDVSKLPLPQTCIEQLLELDSISPRHIVERYVRNLKNQLKTVPLKDWNQTLMQQGREFFDIG